MGVRGNIYLSIEKGLIRGEGGLSEEVTSELVRRMTLRMSGGCDFIKPWDTYLLRYGGKVEVIGEGKEVNIDHQYK